MGNNAFTIISFFYSIILVITFFAKKRVKNIETSLFSAIIITNFLNIVFALVSVYCEQNHIFGTMINNILAKSVIISFYTFSFLFNLYVISVAKNEGKEKFKFKPIIIIITYVILLLPVLFLKIYYFHKDNIIYTYGPSVSYEYIVIACMIIYWFILLLCNIKVLKKKKCVPIISFVVLLSIVAFIQKIHPELLLLTSLETIVTYILFQTIENPDVKMMQQLELARDHAEKANRAKSDFLSSMSHEIRTPLNAIVGFSEMIETEDDIEACKEDAKDIVLASHTLLEIVNGILDISKIEANKMEIVNKEYSLLPELENLAKLMVPRIGEKDLKLVTNFAPDIPAVLYGDIGKIKEVITNLLTNAVKYTDSGTINFNVSCINEKEYASFVISVEDTGRGIKADHIDKLFTKFQRLDEDKNTTIEGTGLGLAITKNLVEMMGGKIVVQSEYGKGSIFTVYLKQKIVKLHDGVSANEVVNTNYDFSGKKVLVVDDNALNLKLAKRLLSNYNIEIDTCDSGADAIEKVKENTYDLILLDDMMPKMRGIEALPKMREIEDFNTPVVALTANSLSGMKEVYLNAGFKDYLAKPIEKNELNKILDKYLSSNVKDYSDKKILIVDDNKINVKIASKMLKTYNFEIDEVYSGQECIDKVKENKYDIIFMDYMMPGMDGIEAFNKLKELDGFNTPVVVLTADVVDNPKEKFMKAGFAYYISKPIDKTYLQEVIENLIK